MAMGRMYDAKQEALKAYPTDRAAGVEMFLGFLNISESDFAFEESQSAESYIYGYPNPKIVSNDHAFGEGVQAPVMASEKTLRDEFAGQALMGICAGLCSDHSHEGRPRAFDRVVFSDAAKDAYTLADAMLAARKGGV